MKFDVLVLGGGIIGVSVAVHLQLRGRSVALVDVKTPGSETSFGNAGLIQREGVYPYGFPRELSSLIKYAFNRSPEVRYHPRTLVKLAPFLWKYWFNSHPLRHAEIASSYANLIAHSVSEHHKLAELAGVSHLIRAGGWFKVFRSAKIQDTETKFAEKCREEHGIKFEILNPTSLRKLEPALDNSLLGALHYTQSEAVIDPGALVKAYANYFEHLGGRFFFGNANTLANQWAVDTEQGIVKADTAVITLGPWSDSLLSRLGYRFPLAVKRGYHMHYEAKDGAKLTHPVLDIENGYVIAPMTRGIRLTTGAEFAARDSRKTPVQLNSVEPIARTLFPITKRLDELPWMGCRPCTPDMLPIIGQAPRHTSLWFAFGHAHHGLTLGPVTGRLLAEMMTGEDLIADPLPFSPNRFHSYKSRRIPQRMAHSKKNFN
ncbi:NAD(P)/FAD-dependent oxidoreductase [Legionella jamestowniensis]|uniref:FAD dependent oxidoreductase n=1 Tax=Legionella jamestowniensis TaxID=455 RepID=A0A0W0UZR7_9GAMM|nr:FAD-binding oxidoreductase [Legionella jamestowniensis]KTD13351.1 FAD dependent oxidoreductase [Legionella jamestowniensis]SFL76626.1 D-amino-acid dehydrogenase [Legionella jamestowniensis DSM 19215]